MGMLTLKLKLVSRVRTLCADIPALVKRIGMIVAVAAGVYFHGAVVQSLIIAPILAVITLVCVAIMPDTQGGHIKRFLAFMGEHSLNIWLVHMFFYSTLFRGLVFALNYPFFIYGGMIEVCLIISVVLKRVSILFRRNRCTSEN